MDQPARRVAYGSLNSECRCLKLVDTFRFGLFRSVRAIDAPMEITVYPKALPLEVAPNQGALGACRELAPSKQESTTYEPSLVCKLLILGCRPLIPDRLLVGDATGFSRPSFSGEVRSSREFQQSDDLRHIHWRNSARSGQLMVKEFDQTPRGGEVRMALNPGVNLGWGRETTLEYAIKIAASLARYSFNEGRQFRMWPGGVGADLTTWHNVLEHTWHAYAPNRTVS